MLSRAIENKEVVEVLYEDRIWRTIEPHTFGFNTGDNLVVSAFRTKKASNSAEVPDWRMYRADKILEVRATGTRFHSPRPGYSSNPKNFRKIIKKVA